MSEQQMNTPTFPSANTLIGRALIRLMQGRRFTHRDFQNETASYRLSSRIERLRNRYGWQIEAIKETALTSDPAARTATYARYFLDPDYLRSVRAELGSSYNEFIDTVRRFENKAGK
jgi:hypothetical protein